MVITKEIFKTDDGYGYKIFVNGKTKILQEYKPAVMGNQAMTEHEADKLSDLVIAKMSDVLTEDEKREIRQLASNESRNSVESDRLKILSSKGNPTLSEKEVTEVK